MARDGLGNYSLPVGNPVVAGTTISDTWANTTLNDIASALTYSIAKDGQTVPTANLPMGGYKLTGLGDGSASGQAIVYGQTTIPSLACTAFTWSGNPTHSGNHTFSGNLAYQGTLTGGTGIVNLGSGQFYKDASGNVGVGTATPSVLVHIKGAGANPRFRTESTGGVISEFLSDTNNIGQIGTNSNHDFVLITNSSERVRVTSDGRLYGKSLHNNAGSVTGTTNQYIASGTYSPTITAVGNVSASSALASQWIRVGNVVSVSGEVSITATAGGSSLSWRITLPVASTIANQGQLAGTGVGGTLNIVNIYGDIASGQASFTASAPGSGNSVAYSFTFQYEVK